MAERSVSGVLKRSLERGQPRDEATVRAGGLIRRATSSPTVAPTNAPAPNARPQWMIKLASTWDVHWLSASAVPRLCAHELWGWCSKPHHSPARTPKALEPLNTASASSRLIRVVFEEDTENYFGT